MSSCGVTFFRKEILGSEWLSFGIPIFALTPIVALTVSRNAAYNLLKDFKQANTFKW